MNLGGIKVGSLELEQVINERASVHECPAVAVQPDGAGPERLVVYVVLEEDDPPADLEREIGARIAGSPAQPADD